jgi:hypothetical protein
VTINGLIPKEFQREKRENSQIAIPAIAACFQLGPAWADLLRWEMEAPGSVANSGASALGQASVHAKQRVIPSQALRFNMKQ